MTYVYLGETLNLKLKRERDRLHKRDNKRHSWEGTIRRWEERSVGDIIKGSFQATGQELRSALWSKGSESGVWQGGRRRSLGKDVT